MRQSPPSPPTPKKRTPITHRTRFRGISRVAFSTLLEPPGPALHLTTYPLRRHRQETERETEQTTELSLRGRSGGWVRGKRSRQRLAAPDPSAQFLLLLSVCLGAGASRALLLGRMCSSRLPYPVRFVALPYPGTLALSPPDLWLSKSAIPPPRGERETKGFLHVCTSTSPSLSPKRFLRTTNSHPLLLLRDSFASGTGDASAIRAPPFPPAYPRTGGEAGRCQ